MQVNGYNTANTSDNGLRSQRATPGLRPPAPGSGHYDRTMEDIGDWQGSQLPGMYLLLLSRVENSLANNEDAHLTLERLERLLERRLAQMPMPVQRRLTALPDFQRLNLEHLGELPRAARTGLRERAQAQRLLALLKSAPFVAAMKDLPQATTYSPAGYLRAS